MRFLEASKNGSFFSGLFRAHHLAQHFGLSSALVAIPAGKEVLLVSHLAHSPAPPCPLVATSLPNQEHRRAR